MTETTVRWRVDDSGYRKFIRRWPKTLQRFGDALAEHIVLDVKEELSKSTSPASPGLPPGVVTDKLRSGMKSTKKGKYKWWVHDTVEYGMYLELGRVNTRTGAHMNWPFLTPVFLRWRNSKLKMFAAKYNWEAEIGIINIKAVIPNLY